MDGRHEEAATKAEAYGERVRDEQRKKRTADRRRSENLSEENREAQRRRLVDDMPEDVRERQQASNQRSKETAVCDGCGAAKTSSEYVKSQWQYRKQTVPTCRECQLKRKLQQYGERSSARQRSKRN